MLILDEPTAGLDPKGREMVFSQIKEYHHRLGSTVLLVSHSMEDISRIADRIMVMNKGNLEMFDTPRKVFSEVEKLESMGLRVPQVTKIMMLLREKGYDIPDGILTVEQALYEVVNLLKREGKL